MVNYRKSKNSAFNNRGFTLIELMIVVAIIGILAAIAYPNYQKSVIKTKRTDAMTTLQSLASDLQAQKMAKGSYGNLVTADTDSLIAKYAAQGSANLYTITINLDSNGDNTKGDWIITATPKTTPSNLSQMQNDGTLTLDVNGVRCRNTACGTNGEWNN